MRNLEIIYQPFKKRLCIDFHTKNEIYGILQ